MERHLKQIATDCLKVVVFGPESSGKTTLSRKLATHYNVLWIEEFAREYLQDKWDKEKKICEIGDLLTIAYGQIKLENESSQKSSKLLICDTDLLETKVYSETYFDGFCDPLLEKYAIQNKYNLYILTDIDIPWVKDDLRDRPNNRLEMFNAFKQALIKYDKPYITVSGDVDKRMQIATKKIDELLIKQ